MTPPDHGQGDTLDRFRKRVSPAAFTRCALLLSVVWFLIALPLWNLLSFESMPLSWRPLSWDFGAYYAGATVAKYGIWSSLYPVPKPEVYGRPPEFRPQIKTRLFDDRQITGNLVYYPSIAYPAASDFSQKLLELSPVLKDKFVFRYVYPPPLALLLRPLASFDFDFANQHIWPLISMLFLFGIGFFSARIHRLLRGEPSYTEGLILLAFAFFTFRGPTGVHEGNATPILGGLIAFTAYAWIRDWQAGVGIAIIPLLLFKGIGLNWCPFLVAGRLRWRSLLTLAALSILINAATVFVAGAGVYHAYFTEVLPKLIVPVGVGPVPQIFQRYGYFPSHLYACLGWALCGVLFYGLWRKSRAGSLVERHAAAVAALAGGVALFCLLNFSVWMHYYPSYLFFPFLGWLAWEGVGARGSSRAIIIAAGGLGYALSCDWFFKTIILLIFGVQSAMASVIAFNNLAGKYYPYYFPLLFLILALWRLYLAPATTPTGVHSEGSVER